MVKIWFLLVRRVVEAFWFLFMPLYLILFSPLPTPSQSLQAVLENGLNEKDLARHTRLVE